MTELHINVLGPLEMKVGGRPVDPGTPKARALLSALVLNRGRVVSVDSLVDILWGDRPPATAHKSIHKYVSGLRRSLGSAIVTRPPGYLVDPDAAMIDVARFEEILKDGRGETDLEEALALWRGAPHPELAETDAGRAEATRLDELRLQAIETLLRSRIEGGRHTEVIGELETLVAAHPYRENLWSLLMRALYRAGRQSDALAAYARLGGLLGEQLGIEPSPELASLEEQILLHDPALKPPATAGHNLPTPLTSFVGRDPEMRALAELLAGRRLVVLLGPAGSGKTRLAIETGRANLDRFADGVWFVDLASIRSEELVFDTIANTLGVGGLGEREVSTVLHEYLANRHLLLILDNCEHLVGRVAEVARGLLGHCPELVILATSRERIGLPGETLFDVSPLPYPEIDDPVSEDFDAVRLFMERVRSGGNAQSRPTEMVGEIVRRLDGIPLALELAAARVRGLGLTALRDGLDDRFSLLASSTEVERHQTLAEAVEWSFRLLTPHEQVLFGRLSVFRGPFDLQAVVEVCGYEPLHPQQVPGTLADLVDSSLVTITGDEPRRYRLLETLREYALVVAAAEETTRLRGAHAAHYLWLAEEANRHLRGPGQTSWLATLRSDHDNLLAALRWGVDNSAETMVRLACALGPYWDTVGPRSEGHEWLVRAAEASDGVDPVLRVDTLLEASNLFSSQRASLPRAYADQALTVAREIRYDLGVARALRALSWAYAIDGETVEARVVGMEAFDYLTGHDDRWELALWYERMGQASFRDPAGSLKMLERALDLYREVGDRGREALVLYKIAEQLAGGDGDLGRAVEYAQQAIVICQEVGNVHDGAHARLEYGKVLRRAGRTAEAIAVLGEAHAQLSKQGDERCTLRTLAALGTTYLDAGDPAAAESPLRESLERGRMLADPRPIRTAIAGMARIAAESGDPARAATLLGFVDELGLRLDIPASEVSQGKRGERLALLEASLGRTELDRLWEQGHGLSAEEAVDLALATGMTARL
ncbi:MAG: BTAD domain-containing putative transcriptional regulator [Acidimicrobiia bacterium]